MDKFKSHFKKPEDGKDGEIWKVKDFNKALVQGESRC